MVVSVVLPVVIYMWFFQVAEEIWVCEKQSVTKWEGTIFDYKEDIIKKLDKERRKRERENK